MGCRWLGVALACGSYVLRSLTRLQPKQFSSFNFYTKLRAYFVKGIRKAV